MSAEAPARTRHGRVGLICAAVVAAMIGATYAAVPLYRMFCQVTGFDGTVKRGAAPTEAALARAITVRFDTNVRGLPWRFRAEETSQKIKIGEPGMAFFKVRNEGDRPLTGRATFNVVPEAAGAYFVKTQCFCFDNQTIPGGTEMRFPVIYYVQPKFASDRETRLFDEITLSYTFFPAGTDEVAAVAPQAREGLGGSVTPRL